MLFFTLFCPATLKISPGYIPWLSKLSNLKELLVSITSAAVRSDDKNKFVPVNAGMPFGKRLIRLEPVAVRVSVRLVERRSTGVCTLVRGNTLATDRRSTGVCTLVRGNTLATDLRSLTPLTFKLDSLNSAFESAAVVTKSLSRKYSIPLKFGEKVTANKFSLATPVLLYCATEVRL